MTIEEKILKKLFNMDGELCVAMDDVMDFERKKKPDYVSVKLFGNVAELYSVLHHELEDLFITSKELSEEDIIVLKKEGYEWQ
jgi:hypothetical protein